MACQNANVLTGDCNGEMENFRMEKGLKIHCSKKGCSYEPKNRAAPDMRTGKTSNSTRPEDNHSPECVYLADILSAFCIPMGYEGTLIDLPFI